jgi:CRISPR/Cas system-associated exonuclease Cas4 (RecB family)
VPSAATARGTVTHKAIELTLNLPGETPPLDLVDEAIARLQQSDAWLAEWLQTCSDAERAEVRAEANDLLVKFLDCWPPLRPQWRPAPESRLTFDLLDGRVVLAGKVDLALGRAEGTRAGKVLVDLKTGRFSPTHREDLRFYALIEALRLGVPPRRVATHYLDSGHLHTEDVTVDLLEAAVARTVDGVVAMVELRDPQRPLEKKPGPACGWCALADECAEGQAWLSDERGY